MLPNWTAANFGYQISITDANGMFITFRRHKGRSPTEVRLPARETRSILSPNEPVALTVSLQVLLGPILSVDWSSLPPLTSTQGASVE